MSSGLLVRNVVAQNTAAARRAALDLAVAGGPVVVVAEMDMEPEPDELPARATLTLATRMTTDSEPTNTHGLERTPSHPCIMP
jgi:hypothetical protein